MPYPAKLQEFLDDLAMFPDRADRIDALISIGQRFKNPDEETVPRTPQTRVPGCESEVFVASKPEGQGRRFLFGVDNPQGISAMALAQILDESLTAQPPSEVEMVSEDVVYDIFGKELSMGKSLGLTNMVRMVKQESKKGD
ncbi:MAG: SufE family protein [Chlorobia bacterium]|nr:SufE family protein [Fimbriimonadaceae bacterium]